MLQMFLDNFVFEFRCFLVRYINRQVRLIYVTFTSVNKTIESAPSYNGGTNWSDQNIFPSKVKSNMTARSLPPFKKLFVCCHSFPDLIKCIPTNNYILLNTFWLNNQMAFTSSLNSFFSCYKKCYRSLFQMVLKMKKHFNFNFNFIWELY